jgi:signal transduction histidine kinase/CheY-like chemotaxis protein
MPTPLRVLILEDRPSDAELMVLELERAGFEPDWQRVDNEADYLGQLRAAPDVILADHTLPQFSAPQALDLLKERGLDIPFIVVTGSISEEVAVERIKQGAADYVLKDRMMRLGPAVQHALEQKKLREQKRQAEEEIQRNLERIRALHEIDMAITSTLDLRTVLHFLLERIDVFLPYSAATTVRLFNKETGLLEPEACWNINETVWKEGEGRSGRGLAQVVFETRASLMVRNVPVDPRARDREFFGRYGLVSYLGVPLMAKREVVGVLGFYTKEEHEFSGEEIEFLSTLASQAAIAIHNSQLYEQTRKHGMELENALKVKDEFLSVMSHELRTPLNVVMGYTELIKDGVLGKVNPAQREALDKVLARANDQVTMINSILYATALEAETVRVETHEVVLTSFLDNLRSVYGVPMDKEVSLNWDYPSNLPIVKTDSAKLREILQHLIDNAIKFTDKGTVTVSVRVKENDMEFRVTDTGIGIPKEALSFIFEKFRQLDSSETRPYGGVGLGLYIVKKFTELLRGKVEVESEPGKGSTFTVSLPFKR